MKKEGLEVIQMHFDLTGVESPLVQIVRAEEPIITEGPKKPFHKQDRILVPMITKLGYKWVTLLTEIYGTRLKDHEDINGKPAYQTPIEILTFYGKYQKYDTYPAGTIFGAYAEPNRKKR